MARRSIWMGSFVYLFLMMKKRENEVSNVGLCSRDAKSSSASLSSILPKFVDCSIQIYNGKILVRFCFYMETKTFENKYWTGKKGEKLKSKRHMPQKGNPISIRLDLNRSSDSSRFSEGDRESHRRVLYYNRRRWRMLQMVGMLRPWGTVERFYRECEVQDTWPIDPANNSPMRQSLAHPGARHPAPLERPSLI
ncbi:unnamed protein product [Victoria cruziana]